MIFRRRGPRGDTPSYRPSRPPFDTIPPSAPERIDKMRDRLAACTVIDKRPKIIFANVIRNLVGVTPIAMGGLEVMALRTNLGLYVLSKEPPESLYEFAGGLGSVDFKRKCVLETPSGSLMYLSRITQQELVQIMNVTMFERESAKRFSIPPPEDGLLSIDELRLKLVKCTVVSSPDRGFDPAGFAASLRSVSASKDFKGNQYYHLIAGENESYRMYVNPEDASFPRATTLAYKDVICVLVREEMPE